MYEYDAKSTMPAGYAAQGNPLSTIDRAPQIGTQLEILAKEISAQRDILERLAVRLEPALSMAPPPTEPKDAQGNRPTCAIANHIAELAGSVAANTRIASALIGRLEV